MAPTRAAAVIRSRADGFRHVGLRRLAVAAVMACVLPSILGGMLLVVLHMAALAPDGSAVWPRLQMLATLATLSPLLGWPALAIALPAAALLLSRGWFGWLPALLLGAVTGAAMGPLTDITVSLPLGLVNIALLRAALSRLAPGGIAP